MTVRLLGNLRIEGTYHGRRTATPSRRCAWCCPDVLRSAADRLFTELTAYLSGNRQRLRSGSTCPKRSTTQSFSRRSSPGADRPDGLIARARQNRLISEDELNVPVLTPETLYRQLEDMCAPWPRVVWERCLRHHQPLHPGPSEGETRDRRSARAGGRRVTMRRACKWKWPWQTTTWLVLSSSRRANCWRCRRGRAQPTDRAKDGTIGGVDARPACRQEDRHDHQRAKRHARAGLFRHDLMVVILALILSLSGLPR